MNIHVLDTHVLVDGSLGALFPVECPGPTTCQLARRSLTVRDPMTASAQLNAWALEDCVNVAIHAGVVASGPRAAAFPGASGAGKTVLTLACLLRGAEYVSDEALVLTGDGAVRPYPKPVNLKADSHELLGRQAQTYDGKRCFSTAAYGPTATGPLALGHLVLLRRRPGPAALSPVRKADVADRLIAHGFNHYRDPRGFLRVITRATREADCVELGYASPDEGAEAVLSLLAG